MIQAVVTEDERPFAQKLDSITDNYEQAQLHLHVKDKEGYLEAKELEQYLSEQPEIYICGGTKFLHSIINSLKN